MCAKLTTKKSKQTFKDGITSILESHHLFLEPEVLEPLLKDFEEFFNNTFSPDDSTMFWSELVSQWISFYQEVTGDKPEFTPIEAMNLKRLNKVLRIRYMNAKVDGIWDLHTCITQQEIYYRSATTISFYKQALSLTNLYSKFNEIVAQLSAIKKKQKESLVN